MARSQIETISVISDNYPEQRFPEKGAFVEKLVNQWLSNSLTVDVIAPRSIPNHVRLIGKKRHNLNFAGRRIERPVFMSFSNKKIANIDFEYISYYFLRKAALRSVKKIPLPDLFYGKFLMRGGHAALDAGKKFKRPAIVDLGECYLLEQMNKKEKELARKIVPQFDGIVCVSKRLVDEAQKLGADKKHILYAPNTVDTDKFYPMDKKECRVKLNLPEDDFIVIFVGHFIERKGPIRVLEAINSLDEKVKGLFMGRGPQSPVGEKVIFSGAVPNDELSVWLNAADVFVLPTLAEGYCNAINEAIACGLPVISSDIPDIRPQVSDKMGILVDPQDSKEISDAIQTCLENKDLLDEYSNECIKQAKMRFSESRGTTILNWLNGTLKI